MAARETGEIDELCDRLRHMLVELRKANPTTYQLCTVFLDARIDLWFEDARQGDGEFWLRRQLEGLENGGR